MSTCLWPKRLFALDVSRGFAALAVVVWHWQHFAYIGSALPQDFDRASQPFYEILKMFYATGAMGVDYFFHLSGFIFFWLYRDSIKQKLTSFRKFWIQRISRLYPLHFVTLLIVALLQWAYTLRVGNSFVYSSNDLYHFILNLSFISKWGFESGHSFNYPVWSVSIELLLYLVFFVAAYKRQGGPLFCLSVSIISFIIAHYAQHAVFRGLSMFFLGGFVFHSTVAISTKLHKLKVLIYLIAVLAWSLVIINFYVFDLSSYLLKFSIPGKILLIGFPGYILFPFTVCGLALFEIEKGQILKSLSWIGDITYSSYLLHFPLQLIFGLTVSYGFLNPEFYFEPIHFLLFFSILIPFSYITFIGFERPMQNIIRKKFTFNIKAHKEKESGDQSTLIHYRG